MTAIKTKRYSMWGITSVIYDELGEAKLGKPLIFDFGEGKVYNNLTWKVTTPTNQDYPFSPDWKTYDMPEVPGNIVISDGPFNRVKVATNCPYPFTIKTDGINISGHWTVKDDDDPRICYGVQSVITLLPPRGYIEYDELLSEPTNPTQTNIAAFQAARAQLRIPYVFGVTIYRDVDGREISLSENRKVDLSIIQAGGF